VQVIAASLPPSPIEENLSESQPHRHRHQPGKSDSSLKPHDSSSGSNVVNSSSSAEDDSSSVWSIQVHASSEKGDAEELGEELGGFCTEEEEFFTEEEGTWEEGSEGCFDDLCEEMSKMAVFDEEEEKEKAGLPQFEGKHTRFIYNSDDEIEREAAASAEARAELDALLLRSVHKGRHLRFQDDEDED
jgi:hypothetical protein